MIDLTDVYEKMIELYTSWPSMLIDGYKKGLKFNSFFNKSEFENIILCGMGGSGIVGKYFESLYDMEIPLSVVREHIPPSYLTHKSLVVAISYSGETLETLSCAIEAKKRGSFILAISDPKSSLGKVIGEERVIPVKQNILPRTALPDMLGSLLGLFYAEKVENTILKASERLRNIKLTERSEEIAREFYNKLPVISSCGRLSVMSIRWSQELAENAKTPSLIERYPESAHNSIVGWEFPPKIPFTFLIIKYNNEGLCNLVEDMLPHVYNNYGKVIEVDLRNESKESMLNVLLLSSLLAGLTSVELARLKRIEPQRTKNIEIYKSSIVYKLKEELMRRLDIG